jgi:hypothetical protein
MTGVATRGNKVTYGEYGLQTTEPAWITAAQIEAARIAPNCAICTMRCGNTDNYDLARLWAAPEDIRTLKLRLLAAVFRLAQGRPDARAQEVIDQALFVLAEDWDEELLAPVVKRAEVCCAG